MRAPPSLPLIAAPPPPPGLSAWTEGAAPGPARLPWLPDDLSHVPNETVFLCAALVVGGVAMAAQGAWWQQAVGAGLLAAAAAAGWLDHRQRAGKRMRSFVAIDPAAGTLRVAEAATVLDITLPIATLRAVGVLAHPEGDRVMLRRDGAPDVMASGALPPAAAREAAAALAWRLGMSNEAGPGAWAPGPAAVLADAAQMQPATPAPPADPPHAEVIPLVRDPAAEGREVLWIGGALGAFGLVLLVLPAPGVMRWIVGPVLVVAGLATARTRAGRVARARARAAVIDRIAGTLTLRGLARVPDQAIALAAIRRVVVVQGNDFSWVAIDLLDRPRIALPITGPLREVEVEAEQIAGALGCPMERDH
jgi:hypothetical protein